LKRTVAPHMVPLFKQLRLAETIKGRRQISPSPAPDSAFTS